jgi:hypothetical protein
MDTGHLGGGGGLCPSGIEIRFIGRPYDAEADGIKVTVMLYRDKNNISAIYVHKF